ncbi:hypothetical protein BC940DRAFT_308720 [Gongronella butleri]|nr:hypothetical protein BC940DRAFT_308720 [Gongronella butleri]
MTRLNEVFVSWSPERQQLFKSSVATLSEQGVADVATFLAQDLQQLHEKHKIPIQILTCLRQVLVHDICSELAYTPQPMHFIPTRHQRLNTVLRGGLPAAHVIELVSKRTEQLEEMSSDLIQDFLSASPRGRVYHMDTEGSFQTRLRRYNKADLARIQCFRVMDLVTTVMCLDQVGAKYLVPRTQRLPAENDVSRPLSNALAADAVLVVIEDMSHLLGSDWNVTDALVQRLGKTVRQLLDMGLTILASHHWVSHVVGRYDVTWDSMVDLRLLIKPGGAMVVTKARHIVILSYTGHDVIVAWAVQSTCCCIVALLRCFDHG